MLATLLHTLQTIWWVPASIIALKVAKPLGRGLVRRFAR